ncbi:Fc receptor, IgE, high affinity I, gamma polypeptide like isoform X1 [Myripristis murdjan]|uniref:Fc receptor, IgE, high affinity I, gamma polypeptide like isoform X1 n=1 Tax=Myripristis murdjan TaxID=586833 RepID=UPI001175D140|nr:high affinity immunoglobulin epsilon receptor subunit gamma-like isoform X1 [Myripristis murdjan]
MMRGSLFVLLLMINVTDALGMNDVNLCYVLDGILIFYGIILTVLYCRLRMHPFQVHHVARPEKQPYEGGIYAVRLFILMLKKTLKMAHDGKVRAYGTADGPDTP